TSGGGGHNVIICKDASTFSTEKQVPIINSWLQNKRTKNPGREWAYDGNKTKIIIEEYIEPKGDKSLIDYKIYCCNGEPLLIHITIDRESNDGKKVGFYDLEFNQLPIRRTDIKPIKNNIAKPINFDKMLEIAKVLSSDFPHVR